MSTVASAPPNGGSTGPRSPGAGRAARWRRPQAGWLLHGAGLVAALIPVAAVVFVLAVLLQQAYPAIGFNGTHFLFRSGWRLGNTYGTPTAAGGVSHFPGSYYGAWPLIAGTLESSLIAVVVAVPVAVAAALAVTQKLPAWLASAVGFFLELLAGIPSVIIGLWGALTFGPILAHDVAPLLARMVPAVPGLDFLRGPTGNGEGLLTSGLILALMIIPIVAATTRDLLRQVPMLAQEGAQALGMSEWEVTRRVTLPWIGSGVIGAVALGLGRALGETMAVAMVSGVSLEATAANLYGAMTTISATIVSQLDSALTDATGFAVRTLAEAGLVLVLITLAVNLVARLLVRRVSAVALPVGRGM